MELEIKVEALQDQGQEIRIVDPMALRRLPAPVGVEAMEIHRLPVRVGMPRGSAERCSAGTTIHPALFVAFVVRFHAMMAPRGSAATATASTAILLPIVAAKNVGLHAMPAEKTMARTPVLPSVHVGVQGGNAAAAIAGTRIVPAPRIATNVVVHAMRADTQVLPSISATSIVKPISVRAGGSAPPNILMVIAGT